MVSNYFLGMDNIPNKVSKPELIKMAKDKTDTELNSKKFYRRQKLADIAALGAFGAGTLLYNGAALSTLMAITDFLPCTLVFALDRIIRAKSEKYRKFRQQNQTSTTLGLFGVGYGSVVGTRYFFSQKGRDIRTFLSIQNFYNKCSDFLKNNKLSKGISNFYKNKFPQGVQNFFSSIGNGTSRVLNTLRESNLARYSLIYGPIIIFLANIIQGENFRNKYKEKLQDNFIQLNVMNETGALK